MEQNLERKKVSAFYISRSFVKYNSVLQSICVFGCCSDDGIFLVMFQQLELQASRIILCTDVALVDGMFLFI